MTTDKSPSPSRINGGNLPKKYPPINVCIYCGALDSLTDEHIIPFALNGVWELPKSSCIECAKITKQINQFVARSCYGRLRVRLGVQTRRPKERPSHFELKAIRRTNGRERIVKIPAQLFPRTYLVLKLPEAEILSGIKASTFDNVHVKEEADFRELYDRNYIRQNEDVEVEMNMNSETFSRQLAQIGHAFVAAEIGIAGYRPLLPDFILGKTLGNPFLCIGCETPHPDSSSGITLQFIQRGGRHFIACLFSMPILGAKFPTYQIVCGEIPSESAAHFIAAKTEILNARVKDLRAPLPAGCGE